MSRSVSDEKGAEFHCSFCGKKNSDVRKLISGPAAYVCHDCVDVFTKSFAKKKEEKPKPHCSFCYADHRELIAGKEALICNSCVDMCNEIIYEQIQTGEPSRLS